MDVKKVNFLGKLSFTNIIESKETPAMIDNVLDNITNVLHEREFYITH